MAKKVMVAMSGGVDSSVAALLLKEQGYDVCGVTLKLFGNQDIGQMDKSRACCSLADVEDARRVCNRLGISHYVFQFAPQFHREVISRFAAGYLKGETPNPCIDCNRFIKFSLLPQRAELLGMDLIATGHYARVECDAIAGRYLMRRAKDLKKDQTYVLYAMTQELLRKTLFPLGGLLKGEVRALAAARGLATAEKPDSQDICFVKNGDYAGFLENVLHVSSPPGDFVDRNGTVMGRHKGLIHYTVGQRRGLSLSLGNRAYVLSKNREANTVMIGEKGDLLRDGFTAGSLNLIAMESLREPMNVTVKTRYKQIEAPATLYPLPDGKVRVKFLSPQEAAAPGQAAVFYDRDIVIGGGTIL